MSPASVGHHPHRPIRPLAPVLIAVAFIVPAFLVVVLTPDTGTAALALGAVGLLAGWWARYLMVREVSHGRSALAASVELYRRLFDEAYDAVLIADPIAGTVLDANRTAGRMFGYTRDQMRRLSLRQLQPAECGDRLTTANGGEPVPGRRDLEELTCIRKGGERFQADLRGGIILVNGRAYTAWIVRDASEQRGLQERRR